jgi:hypothetical protein
MSIEFVKILPREFDDKRTAVSGYMMPVGLVVSPEAKAWSPFLEPMDGYRDVFSSRRSGFPRGAIFATTANWSCS